MKDEFYFFLPPRLRRLRLRLVGLGLEARPGSGDEADTEMDSSSSSSSSSEESVIVAAGMSKLMSPLCCLEGWSSEMRRDDEVGKKY